MAKNNTSTISELQYSLLKIKDFYSSELNKENKKLLDLIKEIEIKQRKKKRISIKDVEESVKIFWKELIFDVIDLMINKISSRKTKGSEFNKILKEITKIKEELPHDNPDIITLKSIYEETLRDLRDEIKEKIDIEKYNNKRFWQGLFFGFLLGIIASVIIWILTK